MTKQSEHKVYVVMGYTGEYSDHEEWYVRAFMVKEKAETFAVECKRIYREALVRIGEDKFPGFGKNEWRHPLDPGFTDSYTGTEYTVLEVPLEVEVLDA